MTDGITLSGGWMVANRTVGVMIAGLDCGNFLVATDGTVFVPFGSDAAGLLTPAYLNQVSNPTSTNPSLTAISIFNSSTSETLIVEVPVVMGYVYASSGLGLRPATEAQMKTQQGPGVGKLHHVLGIGAQVVSAALSALQLKTADGTPITAPFLNGFPNGNPIKEGTLFTGVTYVVVPDDMGFDSQIGWTITRPLPCSIVGLTSFLETEER